ncbi:hypothetical protein BH11MYX3_BH11MYX3_12350 [soil metagenome]
MRRTILLLLLAAFVFGIVAGCGGKKGTSIAKLTKKEGPVDRQQGEGEWKAGDVGTEFSIGDAARTADGAAGLEVVGGAQIAMQPHTILRFGGQDGNSKILVELGAIELTGSGNYALDGGDVKLSKGTVRITAKGGGKNTIELTIGDATVSTVDGGTISLEVGKVVDLGFEVSVTTIDAGVCDAAVVDAPIDAPDVAQSDQATIEVTGKKAEIQLPGETTWKPLPAGVGALAKGTKVRLGTATTAKLTARGTTLDLAGGSRATLGEDLSFTVETGSARASTPAKGTGKISIPGGSVTLDSTPTGSEIKVDVTTRDSKVTDTRGAARLNGSGGGELVMNRGESATLAKNGTIRVIEAIPSYYDFKVSVGETVTIHDPKGATAVQFVFGGKCTEGGFIEMDHDPRFRTAKVSGGKDSANLSVGAGSWAYRLRCTTASGDSAAVGSGRIAVQRDSGSRALPKQPATNDIDADGRNYRVSYQSVIPTMAVRIKGEGAPFTLHMASGGKDETFNGPGPKIMVSGTKLKEGTYTYWIDRNGVKDPKVSTLTIDFDNTAPQVYIEAPANGKPWEGDIEVRGAVLPGWTAAVDAVSIPIDKQRRFAAKVPRPAGSALAIKLSHPQRGVHYYLRRSGN